MQKKKKKIVIIASYEGLILLDGGGHIMWGYNVLFLLKASQKHIWYYLCQKEKKYQTKKLNLM